MELVQACQLWPENWTLVLHSRMEPSPDYLRQLYEADYKKRVVFSLKPVPLKDLGKIISSADVGIVPADDTTGNCYYIGLSSGKLAQYLKHGIPVVTMNFPGLDALMNKYRCGETIDDLSEIKNAVKRIISNRKEYRANSLKCFDDVFCLERYFPEIVERLETVLSNVG